MANCLGWFGVRGVSSADVARELKATFSTAKRDDIPELFRVFEPPRLSGLASLPRTSSPAGWTVVLLSGTGSQYAVPVYSVGEWAQALSLRLGAAAVAFLTLEGGWSYWVFENGNEVVGQEHYTLPLPAVYGDVARGAMLLGVEESIFGRYEQAWKDDRAEPFPGDEFAPTDEWGHVDFARRLGLHYPDDVSGGEVVAPTEVDRGSAKDEWQGLPGRLDPPEPPPHPDSTGEEIDFENFPAGDEPF